jgi:hypothetical protein
MYIKTAWMIWFISIGFTLFGQSGLEIIVEENNDGLTITKSTGTAKTLVIPETIDGKRVTVIGDGVFSNKGLVEVTIPDSVTSIGDGAFSFNQLSAVSIGGNVVSIGRGAFTANKLTSVTIGNAVTTIGKGAFSGNQIETITIPGSVAAIDDYAFFGNRIKELVIPDSVTLIGEGAFSGNRLTAVVIGGGVTRVRDGAFYNNRISSVTIPPVLETLGKRVFDSRPAGGRVRGSINYTDTSGNVLFSTANNFDTYYVSNGRQPGRYAYAEGSWTLAE